MSQVKLLRPSFICEETGYAYCDRHAPPNSSPAKLNDLTDHESCGVCKIPLTSGVESED
jgi:hypothetical protein